MTIERPLITIITPVYNCEKLLERALQSVSAQTYSHYEHILVNDGSTDTSGEILAAWQTIDAKVQVITQGNRGVSAARNRGLSQARGEWILFLDADDSISAEHLWMLIKASNRNLDAVSCGFVRLNPDGKVHSKQRPPKLQNQNFADIIRRHPVAIHSILLRRELLSRTGAFDETLRTNEDWDLWIRLHRSDCRIKTVPAYSARYWNNPGSLSTDGLGIFQDCATVLRRMSRDDKRVKNPRSTAVAPVEEIEASIVVCGFWALGVEAAAGRCVNEIIEAMPEAAIGPERYTDIVAAVLEGFTIGGSRPFERLYELWPTIEKPILASFSKLEKCVSQPGAARVWCLLLEREIARVTDVEHPLLIGSTFILPSGLMGPSHWPTGVAGQRRLVKIRGLRPRSLAIIEWTGIACPLASELWRKLFLAYWRSACRYLASGACNILR